MNAVLLMTAGEGADVSDEELMVGYLALVEVMEKSAGCRASFGVESKEWRGQLKRLGMMGKDARAGYRLRRGVKPDGVEFVEVGDEPGRG